MTVSTEVKKESSVPVQGRISILGLAELDMYWQETGHYIRTMSQLLSWSVDLLCEVLRANEMLPREFTSVADAHQHLLRRGLYQRSTEKRAFDKIGAAIRFENLRATGVDPKDYVAGQYNILHNPRSVSSSPVRGTRPDVVEGVKIMEELERQAKSGKSEEEAAEEVKKAVDAARESGHLVEESSSTARQLTRAEMKEREKEIERDDRKLLSELNKPVDKDELGKGVVK